MEPMKKDIRDQVLSTPVSEYQYVIKDKKVNGLIEILDKDTKVVVRRCKTISKASNLLMGLQYAYLNGDEI